MLGIGMVRSRSSSARSNARPADSAFPCRPPPPRANFAFLRHGQAGPEWNVNARPVCRHPVFVVTPSARLAWISRRILPASHHVSLMSSGSSRSGGSAATREIRHSAHVPTPSTYSALHAGHHMVSPPGGGLAAGPRPTEPHHQDRTAPARRTLGSDPLDRIEGHSAAVARGRRVARRPRWESRSAETWSEGQTQRWVNSMIPGIRRAPETRPGDAPAPQPRPAPRARPSRSCRPRACPRAGRWCRRAGGSPCR